MKGKTKTQKGITLVALIITIVILLILAAVAVATIQNDGILSRANEAATQYNQKVGEEGVALGNLYDSLNPYFPGSEEGEDPDPEPPTPTTVTWTWTQNKTTVTGTPSTGEAVTVAVGDTITNYDEGVDAYNGGWSVLGAEDGKLLLVSNSYVYKMIKWGSYSWIYDEGDESKSYQDWTGNFISTSYVQSVFAETSRIIDADDINRVTGYTPSANGYTYNPSDPTYEISGTSAYTLLFGGSSNYGLNTTYRVEKCPSWYFDPYWAGDTMYYIVDEDGIVKAEFMSCDYDASAHERSDYVTIRPVVVINQTTKLTPAATNSWTLESTVVS